MEEQVVELTIWNGIIDKVKLPKGVRLVVKEYDDMLDGETEKDENGDEYHRREFIHTNSK